MRIRCVMVHQGVNQALMWEDPVSIEQREKCYVM